MNKKGLSLLLATAMITNTFAFSTTAMAATGTTPHYPIQDGLVKATVREVKAGYDLDKVSFSHDEGDNTPDAPVLPRTYSVSQISAITPEMAKINGNILTATLPLSFDTGNSTTPTKENIRINTVILGNDKYADSDPVDLVLEISREVVNVISPDNANLGFVNGIVTRDLANENKEIRLGDFIKATVDKNGVISDVSDKLTYSVATNNLGGSITGKGGDALLSWTGGQPGDINVTAIAPTSEEFEESNSVNLTLKLVRADQQLSAGGIYKAPEDNGTYDLTGHVKGAKTAITYTVATNDINASVSGNTLTWNGNQPSTPENEKDILITATAAQDNIFNSASVTFKLEINNKTDVSAGLVKSLPKVGTYKYNAAPQGPNRVAGSVSANGYNGSVITEYYGVDNSENRYELSTIKPIKAGNYKVVISVPNENANYKGRAETDFIISRAEQSELTLKLLENSGENKIKVSGLGGSGAGELEFGDENGPLFAMGKNEKSNTKELTGLASNKVYRLVVSKKLDNNYEEKTSDPVNVRIAKVDIKKPIFTESEAIISISNEKKAFGIIKSTISNAHLQSNIGTPTYEWKSNGKTVQKGKNSDYKIKSSDVGKKITVELSSSNYNGILTSRESEVIVASAPDAIGEVQAVGDDQSLKISWPIPENGGLTIDKYIVNFALSNSNEIENASILESKYEVLGENNTNLFISNLTNGVEYSITVQAENAIGIGAASQETLARPKKALKAEMILGNISGPNNSPEKNGTIIFKDANGRELEDNKARVGEYVMIEAYPAMDMEFVKFTKTAKAEAELFSLTEGNVGEEIFVNPFVYKVEEGSTFDVTFKAVPTVDANTESTLFDINTYSAEGRKLIKPDGTQGFVGRNKDYSIYLTVNDTKSLSFTPEAIKGYNNVTVTMTNKVGAVYNFVPDVDDKQVSRFVTHTYNLTEPEMLKFTVTELGKNPTDYNINVKISENHEKSAAFYGEVKAFAGSEEVELSFKTKNTELYAASMTVEIKDTDLLPGFSNKTGIVFTDGTEDLKRDTNNYFNVNSLFRVDSMRSDGTFLHIAFVSKSGYPIKVGEDGLTLGAVKIKQQNFTGTLEELSELFEVTPHEIGGIEYGSGTIYDRYYGSVTNYDNPLILNQPIYIAPAEKDTLKWTIGNDAAIHDDRIQFRIFDVSDTFPRLITTFAQKLKKNINKPSSTEMRYDLFSGEYGVQVTAKGYLTLDTKVLNERNVINGSISISGKPSTEGIKISMINLMEGDLNNDGIIDATDRGLIISVLGQTASTEGSVNDIYGNYNNDNTIDSLDLGRLLSNFGKTLTSYTR